LHVRTAPRPRKEFKRRSEKQCETRFAGLEQYTDLAMKRFFSPAHYCFEWIKTETGNDRLDNADTLGLEASKVPKVPPALQEPKDSNLVDVM